MKAMIFLRDNAYLKEDLKFEHVKARLLGTVYHYVKQ
jgi:phosphoketolase